MLDTGVFDRYWVALLGAVDRVVGDSFQGIFGASRWADCVAGEHAFRLSDLVVVEFSALRASVIWSLTGATLPGLILWVDSVLLG